MNEEGILQVVIKAMQSHGENADVQDKGLKLCANISYHGKYLPVSDYQSLTSCKYSIERLSFPFVEHGGIQMTLNALSSHGKHAGVQQHGLNALKNLVCVEAHRRVVLDQMGLSVVITALKNHPRKQEVQEHGIGVLANLAAEGGMLYSNHVLLCIFCSNGIRLESTRFQMMEKGVLRLLESAQARYPPDSNVHAECMRFLQIFSG